ncbi:cupredoxin family copper-binding protein [Parabacteroides sp. FAFU027]|uniref:cupredoxin domain-containing protein n=1 Tax=Parabacteroides sp. FAFU027 TaxID=2922715 RepID=UPI001FAF126C|nr:cupredoxin family copper-binding protein [Parabacteroides sp. FAFU027]
MKTYLLISVFLILLLCACSKSSEPGQNEVFIQSMSFNPSSLTVTQGTTVTWTNKESVTHTVTSNTSIFNSGNLSNGGTFSYKFNTVGTFPYHCSIHSGMTGTIIVK